ncbi:MAG: transglutaminase domain-containing protein [Candidatus Krumholzibacteria bacterium]|nr:transglutaminase domain-containing protein [Candidatus Krumholzibacteria bacterium]
MHHPTGIAWDGKSIWVADRKTDMFYRIDAASGATSDSIASPGYFPAGLAWDGKLLWSTDPTDAKIYATDVSSGKTVVAFDSPAAGPMGIAWQGNALWVCDNSEKKISKIDPTDGTTIISFKAPATDPRSIVFGGGYLWCSDRIKDQIYGMDPASGTVVIILDAPGRFSWGLAWKDGRLLNADYQDNAIYEIVAKDGVPFKTYDSRRATVDFTNEATTSGTGEVSSLDINCAIPVNRPNQKLLKPIAYSPAPTRFTKDRWGQGIAVFHFENLESPRWLEVSMKVELETSAIRYFIYPENVGSEIPADVKKMYLADEIKYDITNPYIRDIVKKVVGNETNLYWKARKLFQYLIANMEYQLAGGWNTAPTVLERGNGSCSEYSFSYISLCRAAGVPARYVGSLVVRGDDASYDDVFHRWCEIYLPGYGWIPVDANAGDRDMPADQSAAFGGIGNRFLVTTEGGGSSEYLDWNYNAQSTSVTTGKCRVKVESIAEWEPLE